MNRISSVISLHYRDKWTWIYIPTIILFSIFAVNLLISLLVPREVIIYTGGLTSAFIYLFVTGIIIVLKTFPFAIGMSVRRIDYFFGSIAAGTISGAALSLMILIMAQIEGQTNGWGSRMHFFYFSFINEGTILEQLLVYMICFLFLFSMGMLISSFAKRFGGKGMLTASIVFLLIGSVASYLIHLYKLWSNIFSWFIGKTAIEFAYWLLPFVLIYLLFSFVLLRRANV